MSTYMQIGMRRLVDRVIVSPPSISEPAVSKTFVQQTIGGITIPASFRTCFLIMGGQRGRTVGQPSDSIKKGEYFDDGSSNVNYFVARYSEGTVAGIGATRLYNNAFGVPGDSLINFSFFLISCFK